jgi:hypothetical protein
MPFRMRDWVKTEPTSDSQRDLTAEEQQSFPLRFPTPLPGVDMPFPGEGPDVKPNIRKILSRRYQAALRTELETPSPNFLNNLTGYPNLDDVLFKFSGRENLDQIYRSRNPRAKAQANMPSSVPPWTIPGTDYGVNSCGLLSEIQNHMLEPVVDGGQTWQLWTQAEVLGFLNLRIERFLIETGILRKEYATTATSDGYFSLPPDFLELRRVEFVTPLGAYRPLTRIDTNQADSANPGWEASVVTEPTSYIEEPLAGMTAQLYPPVAGSVLVRYVPLPDKVTAACKPLPIPRMFTWAIKWGVISDLLQKEGEANDPARAQAAEQLWNLGVSLAKMLNGVEN